MLDWTFELNNKPMSTLTNGVVSFPVFSGMNGHINKRSSMCLVEIGPIPVGTYYIFDRQSGGLRDSFKKLFSDHSDWVALYAIDSKIDDDVYCNSVKRGNFRIHPKGSLGISRGCITFEKEKDFQKFKTFLKTTKQEAVPNTSLLAYGRVIIK
jgi:hypothetical protein